MHVVCNWYSMTQVEWVPIANSAVYDVNIGHSLKLSTNLNHYKYMFCWLVDFNEEESDRCFGILFAARETSSCMIDKKCTKMVTQPNLQSYPLTHQILFSIEAEKDVSYIVLVNVWPRAKVFWFLWLLESSVSGQREEKCDSFQTLSYKNKDSASKFPKPRIKQCEMLLCSWFHSLMRAKPSRYGIILVICNILRYN